MSSFIDQFLHHHNQHSPINLSQHSGMKISLIILVVHAFLQFINRHTIRYPSGCYENKLKSLSQPNINTCHYHFLNASSFLHQQKAYTTKHSISILCFLSCHLSKLQNCQSIHVILWIGQTYKNHTKDKKTLQDQQRIANPSM